MTDIQARLYALRDDKNRDFAASLMPTVDKSTMLGVRTPQLRALAKELRGTDEARALLSTTEHEYFEEYQLHAALIALMRDYDEAIAALDFFLPRVFSWATTDMINPAVFKKHRDDLYRRAYRWIDSGGTYCVRYGILTLMNHYLDCDFKPEYLSEVAAVKSEEYYVNMMRAWYFATALAKQWDAALPYIEERRLDRWTHNKAIQKACESYRVPDEHKAILRGYRV
ncbi:MAG: DNA alkylation repair protein [Oscillospiraceae bacterium]|nr:DNA alkylation repair protein [Oscillospiraceae bacterium]